MRSLDIRLLFTTRVVRLFAYGLVSVVLVLYLAELGFSGTQIGTLLTLTLLGDTVISLWITTRADRMGRKKMLLIGAILMLVAGVAFGSSRHLLVLLVAATLGVISPSGNEVGPFLSIEQAALSQVVEDKERTRVFAWYSLAGSLSTALGALAGGVVSQYLQESGMTAVASYRAILLGYSVAGLLLAFVFMNLSPGVETGARTQPRSEPASPLRSWLGLHASRRVVLKLSSLFALDAFGGGFIIQSILAYWFHRRFGVEPAVLGTILFGGNLLAAFSALVAARVASRIGLVRTMVFTHLPSNLLLILVPLMPSVEAAVLVLLARFSISQMDVPTRQSYTMAVVRPDERSAAAGITGVARTTGAAISPFFAAMLVATASWTSLPFFLAGGLKIVYDVLLYRSFVGLRAEFESDR